MTVIVWDGITLATDRLASDGVNKWEAEKAWYYSQAGQRIILSGYGTAKDILILIEWYKAGAILDMFPHDADAVLIAVDDKGLHRYERIPYPMTHGYKLCAFGQGSDLAYGALAMGADARQAVEVANRYSLFCGLGVDEYTLHESKLTKGEAR